MYINYSRRTMAIDPEVLKKLLQTFKEELDEQLQSITNGLLKLEKGDISSEETDKIIESIFRSAHNIKGAARGVGVKNVGDLAHHIETLFSSIQKKTSTYSPAIIDLCLEAIDSMRSAMNAFTNDQPLSFDLKNILSRLSGEPDTLTSEKSKEINTKSKNRETNSEYETIRVSIDSLDRISAVIEEIQVNKIFIEDHYADLAKLSNKIKRMMPVWKQLSLSAKNKEIPENLQKIYTSNIDNMLEISGSMQQIQKNIRKGVNDLATLSDSLEEELSMVRLVPASTLLNTLPRVVRDVSRELNKKIELTITGDSVKMDKMVLEGLKNPLIHLIRNAIDHGIEKSDKRLSLGKPEVGQININVQEEGDKILISVSDDGAGIDVKKIAEIAKDKKILMHSQLDTLNTSDILDVIFSPGFSTKEIITDVSGRGIGLDVVKSNITHLKGQVNVTTILEKGTTFNLRVPFTLASERGLIVMCEKQVFVLPTNIIERILLLKTNSIIDVEADQAILLDQHPIPFRSLAAVLGFQHQPVDSQIQHPVVLLRKNNNAVALLVNEIIGEREIVVKPLQSPLINIPCISGGTLAGNGQVIMVLNTNDLMKTALSLGKTSRVVAKDTSTKSVKRVHILVVDDSITTRTLEKNILESKEYQVTVAVNGKEAWDLLQTQKFSLLITDVSMPLMDGFTLTENVKKDDKLHDLPVIIVTSLESEEEKKRGIEVGADAYIIKSQFESGTLLDIVEQLI